jgi:NADH-quinone oxidoreductase subunit I
MSREAPSVAPDLLVEESQCVGCAICADVCPTVAMTLPPDDLLPTWNASLCTACRKCEQECPTEAISIR